MPAVVAIGVEKDVGKGIIGAMARADLLDSSPSKVQDNVHLFTGLSRQDRSHLIIKRVAICAQRIKKRKEVITSDPWGKLKQPGWTLLCSIFFVAVERITIRTLS